MHRSAQPCSAEHLEQSLCEEEGAGTQGWAKMGGSGSECGGLKASFLQPRKHFEEQVVATKMSISTCEVPVVTVTHGSNKEIPPRTVLALREGSAYMGA